MNKIPKTIHYCWFGNKKKSPLIKKCIESWKKVCPDYEIIEWNEINFDITQNDYINEAYTAKKWAFVTDFVRLKAVYDYGGIYLDTDVELRKKLDQLLKYDAFFAMQDDKYVATGLGFGAVKENKVIKKIIDSYSDIHFKTASGFDTTSCPVRNTKTLEETIGKVKPNSYYQNNIIILGKEYLCPYDNKTGKLNLTKNSIGIHWFNASWRPKSLNMRERILRPVKRVIGTECFEKLKKTAKEIKVITPKQSHKD